MKYIFGIVLLAAGLLLIFLGAGRFRTLRRCRERIDGRYLDRESVSSFRGEKFRLRFEYDYSGRN